MRCVTGCCRASSLCWPRRPFDRRLAQLPGEQLPTQQERDKQYEALSKDVAQLELMGSVLKRVVKLVRPTIVHIEARKPIRLPSAIRTSRSKKPAPARSLNWAANSMCSPIGMSSARPPNRNIHIKLSDGRQISPTKVWSDAGTDVAIMAVAAPNLVPARIGDSDTIDIGDFVLAVGSPFGLSHSVTFGIISAKGRRDLELGDERIQFQDFLQTDAAINPGNSGGPLLNLRGEVVGMNTAIATSSGGSEGIGFTIPINMAMSIARQLIEKGTVVRAFLGVTLDPSFTEQVAANLGLPQVEGCACDRHHAQFAGRGRETASRRRDSRIQRHADRQRRPSGRPRQPDGSRQAVPIVVFRDRKLVRLTVKVGDRAQFDAS